MHMILSSAEGGSIQNHYEAGCSQLPLFGWLFDWSKGSFRQIGSTVPCFCKKLLSVVTMTSDSFLKLS
jgi:hypothetical protein